MKSNLYVLKITADDKEFLKIGLARIFTSRASRMRAEIQKDGVQNIKIEVIKMFNGPADKLWEVESKAKWRSEIERYDAGIIFNGFTECYKVEDLQVLLDYIEDSIVSDDIEENCPEF